MSRRRGMPVLTFPKTIRVDAGDEFFPLYLAAREDDFGFGAIVTVFYDMIADLTMMRWYGKTFLQRDIREKPLLNFVDAIVASFGRNLSNPISLCNCKGRTN